MRLVNGFDNLQRHNAPTRHSEPLSGPCEGYCNSDAKEPEYEGSVIMLGRALVAIGLLALLAIGVASVTSW